MEQQQFWRRRMLLDHHPHHSPLLLLRQRVRRHQRRGKRRTVGLGGRQQVERLRDIRGALVHRWVLPWVVRMCGWLS